MPRVKSALSESLNVLEPDTKSAKLDEDTLATIEEEVSKKVTVKVIDENDFYKPETKNKKIVLKPVSPFHARNNIATVIRPVINKNKKLLTGQPVFTEEEKKKVLKVVTYETERRLVGTVILDLNDPIDVIDWGWMQYHPYIARSKKEAEGSIDARYYIEDLEQENEDFLKKKKHEILVSMALLEMPMTKKRKLARVIGMLVSNVDDSTIEKFLLEAVHKDYNMLPERQILNLIKDEDKLNFLYLAQTLVDRGEITFEMGTYKYNGSIIASNFDEYVSWLNNPDRSSYVVLMNSKYMI